ncbi:enoyl-ACP reductase FabI [Rhodospirillum sp. A1_3_36]|uniref:enoyl-ACP reductase FabI n=1 Tax=Rhodospirillum sp. A1_3_36 TaxID=3391666 RepID=UPI0039A62B2C
MTNSTALLAGKKGLVLGLANDRSIAWGIAKAASDAGAEIAFTYQGEPLLKRVRPLVEGLNPNHLLLPCDVTDTDTVDALFETIKEKWGTIDFVVHAVAFSDKDQLKGKYMDTTRDNFLMSMDISVFSFTDIARRSAAMMNDGGSMITLTYLGAERVMPHYNVMGVAKAALEASVRYLASDLGDRGIRVNAISAGPIKTLAASGIGDFRFILKWNQFVSPMQRNVSIHDVGSSALYLLSDLSKGVTGEVHHVDSGYHTVGMLNINSVPDVVTLLNQVRKD